MNKRGEAEHRCWPFHVLSTTCNMTIEEQHHALQDIHRAACLVATLAGTLKTPCPGARFMSASIYDTAWVAMVSNPVIRGSDRALIRDWLFPECFQYLLDSQRGDGGLGEGGSDVDGLLNTMAATLAFCKLKTVILTSENPLWVDPADLETRISRAKNYLDQALARWDVNAAVHVGFEILVPKLLGLLRDQALEINFSGLSDLLSLNRLKLGKFKPSNLYTTAPTTLLHSLEAFVCEIEMEKMRLHLRYGSMMASQSATAAYLVGLSDWDDEAEAYLGFVVRHGKGRVPSAFPTGVFEYSWVTLYCIRCNLNGACLWLTCSGPFHSA